MNVQGRIEKVTKELVVFMDFESITVKMICEKANVARKTFYTLYKDKFDVIESIFYNEVFMPVLGMFEICGEIKEVRGVLLEGIYQKYCDNREFYMKAFKIQGDNSLEKCIVYYLENFNQKLLKDKEMDDYEKEYLIYYFSTSQMILFKKWVEDGMIISAKKMASIHQKLLDDAFVKCFY
ncbi:MAG: TetR/AcrR family transcriptional regulator [Coprobacillus sp.]